MCEVCLGGQYNNCPVCSIYVCPECNREGCLSPECGRLAEQAAYLDELDIDRQEAEGAEAAWNAERGSETEGAACD